MKMTFLLVATMIWGSCQVKANNSDVNMEVENAVSSQTEIVSEETTGIESTEDDGQRIEKIKASFARINAIKKWDKVKTKNLEGSSEGATATFYILSNEVQKIVCSYMSGTGKTTLEYYLENGQVFFVYEKETQYNRPIYYDKQMMEENGDTEYFDPNKSIVKEKRFYYSDSKQLIRCIINKVTQKMTDEIKEENQRILEIYSENLRTY
jgi:hypothetical protein